MSSFLSAWSVRPGASGLGIVTSSACAMKMFRPEPSYLIAWVAFSSCNWRVGSRLCGADFFPVVPEPWRAGRRAAFGDKASASVEVVAGAVDAMVDEEG